MTGELGPHARRELFIAEIGDGDLQGQSCLRMEEGRAGQEGEAPEARGDHVSRGLNGFAIGCDGGLVRAG